MKCLKLLACILISIFFFSCNSRHEKLQKLWELENTIDYHNLSDDDKKKLESIIEYYESEEKENDSNWDSGFSQQCSVLRHLYFEKHLTKKEYLKKCMEIYERYKPLENKISQQTCGYAICLYYSEQKERSLELFSKILESDCKNNFEYESAYESVMIICTKLLDKNIDYVREYSLFNYIYPMNEDEIILTFVGW